MRVWDYDIPVVIKYIAEPTMHSMPAAGLSPTGKWMAAQSLDNQILIFSTDSFKQNVRISSPWFVHGVTNMARTGHRERNALPDTRLLDMLASLNSLPTVALLVLVMVKVSDQ